MGVLKTVLSVFVRPATVIETELPKCKVPKKALGLVGTVAVILAAMMTLTQVIRRVIIYSCARQEPCTVGLDFGRIFTGWDYFGSSLVNILVNVVVLPLGVAGLVFLATRLFKVKKMGFWEILSLTFLAMLPLVAGCCLNAILGVSYMSGLLALAGAFALVLGLMYALMFAYEGLVAETDITGNRRFSFVMFTMIITMAFVLIFAMEMSKEFLMVPKVLF